MCLWRGVSVWVHISAVLFSVLMLSAYAHKFCFETEKGNGEAEGKREGRSGGELHMYVEAQGLPYLFEARSLPEPGAH